MTGYWGVRRPVKEDAGGRGCWSLGRSGSPAVSGGGGGGGGGGGAVSAIAQCKVPASSCRN